MITLFLDTEKVRKRLILHKFKVDTSEALLDFNMQPSFTVKKYARN